MGAFARNPRALQRSSDAALGASVPGDFGPRSVLADRGFGPDRIRRHRQHVPVRGRRLGRPNVPVQLPVLPHGPESLPPSQRVYLRVLEVFRGFELQPGRSRRDDSEVYKFTANEEFQRLFIVGFSQPFAVALANHTDNYRHGIFGRSDDLLGTVRVEYNGVRYRVAGDLIFYDVFFRGEARVGVQGQPTLFRVAREDAVRQICEKLRHKLKDFLELQNYDWELVEPHGLASSFISDLIAYLQNTFLSFTNLPVRNERVFERFDCKLRILQPEVAQVACKSACEYIANSLQALLLSDEVKQISMGILHQINLDLLQCERKEPTKLPAVIKRS